MFITLSNTCALSPVVTVSELNSHCRENGMYYGGDPPAWTTMPDIPPEALFKLPDSSSSKAGIARLL